MRRRGRVLLPLLAGMLGGTLWLPFGFAPLYPIAFFLLFLEYGRIESSREAVVLGLLMGAGRYAVAGHFLLALLRYSPLAIIFYFLAIAYILPFAVLESWGGLWLEKRTGLPRFLAYGLIWAVLEKVRTLSDLSFPADLVAHGLGSAPAWLAATAWTGPFAVPLWIAVVATATYWGWLAFREGSRRRALVWAAAATLVWIAPRAAAPLLHRGGAENPPVLRVGIVQPFAKVEEKRNPEAWPRLWRRVERLTLQAARGADLVIWPETARPGAVIWPASEPFEDEQVADLSRRAGVPILYGADLFSWEGTSKGRRQGKLYNGAALAGADGRFGPWYGKQRLLPFVEGIPFGDLFGWDPSRRKQSTGYLTMLGNFTAGPKPTVFEVGPARIGVLICFEGMYPHLARRYRLEGANMLAVMTNDAWWGHSVFPRWHSTMAGSRARENDLPVVRAANNGISSVTDRFGRVLASTHLDEITVLEAEVEPSGTPPTFYDRHGDWIIAAALLLMAAALALALIRRREGP